MYNERYSIALPAQNWSKTQKFSTGFPYCSAHSADSETLIKLF